MINRRKALMDALISAGIPAIGYGWNSDGTARIDFDENIVTPAQRAQAAFIQGAFDMQPRRLRKTIDVAADIANLTDANFKKALIVCILYILKIEPDLLKNVNIAGDEAVS